MNIRLATKEDCGQCAKLSEIDELRVADGSFISQDYFESNVDEDEMFFVAEEKGNVVGYILGEPLKAHLALLNLLTVDKSQRNKGVGKQLIAAFEKKCKTSGLKHLLLYAPTFNAKTLSVYTKQGFHVGKTHTEFYKEI